MKTRVQLFFFIILMVQAYKSQAQIYQHNFGTTLINTHPYTVAPSIFNANLNSSSWVNSTGVWTSYLGSSNTAPDQAIALTNALGNPTITLTFNVNSGYTASITSFSFWRRRSATGPNNWIMSINGTNVATSNATTGGGSYTATVNGFTNLTGTVSIVLTLSGATDNAGTFRLDDFTLNGGVAIQSSSATDYFRSGTSGNWNSPSTWQSSPDNSAWITATLVPDNNAASINIQNGNVVTLNSAATVKLLTISSGGTLVHNNGIALNIADDGTNANDFVINGTYVLNGTQPVITSPTRAQVNSLVRVDDNTNGESDNFARNSQVSFRASSVFQWNTSQLFETGTSGIFTYMPTSVVGAIFRVSANLGSVGSSGTNSILFNSKFEVASGYTVKFVRNGFKYFRDGLGGDGTIVHQSLNGGAIANCGLFQITGTSAVIDGTLTIDIEHTTPTTDFELSGTVTISGSPTINIGKGISPDGSLVISGTVINNSSLSINLDSGNLVLSGNITGTGTFKTNSNNTTITVSRTSAGTAGVLSFESGFNTIKDFVMNATGSMGRVALGSALNIANSITLTRGTIVTDNYLLTWNNSGGTITNTTPANSFIATCLADGSAHTYSATAAFDGSIGFRISNISTASGNIFFPVGATYLNSGSSFAATPNRMMINNAGGPTEYFTVVVRKELMIYTPLSGVNRVWYVSEGTPGGNNITMNLYFMKRNWGTYAYPSDQDEIETGFIYSDPHLVQQQYNTYQFVSNSKAGVPPGGDVPSYLATADNTEIFAQYRFGVSPDLNNNTNGIKEFSRFSVFNAEDIILPVSITNLKAYQQGNNIAISWSALNELNVDRYELEHSTNGTNFISISKTIALNNGSQQNNYSAVDVHPSSGINFYRIKSVDKDGAVQYTSVVSVVIGGGKIFIAVIPNPVQNKHINLQLNNIPAGYYDLSLYSITGQRVYTKPVIHAGGSAAQVINLPGQVKTGTYILYLQNKTNRFMQTIIVE